MSSINLQKKWEQVKPQVSHLYQPALRLSQSETMTNTKLGGKPYVKDASFQWPCIDNEPLAFIAQLDLAELAAILSIDWLPTTGILLFFYDVETMPSGLEVNDNELWKVIYFEQSNTEAEFPTNLIEEFQFESIYLEAIKIKQLPSQQRDEVIALNLSTSQQAAYDELCDREIGDQPAHQVSGFPDCIQDDNMELECQQLNSQNEKFDINDWRLLLQLDTDENAEMIWGDCGTLYFWIREQDAKNYAFDKVRLILQCY